MQTIAAPFSKRSCDVVSAEEPTHVRAGKSMPAEGGPRRLCRREAGRLAGGNATLGCRGSLDLAVSEMRRGGGRCDAAMAGRVGSCRVGGRIDDVVRHLDRAAIRTP